MKRKVLSFGIIALLMVCGNLTVSGNDIINSKELFKIMNNDDVVIISTQNDAEYKKVHIKNAIHIDHKSLYNNNEVKSMLKSPSELAEILGAKGISNTNTLVIYDQGSGRYAGRLYWILKYLGCENVQILNGQLKAWMAARKPITKNPTQITKTSFTPNVNKSIYATINEVKAGNATIIDVRSTGEFDGTNGETDPKGHIPGAVNIDYKNYLDDKMAFKSQDQIGTLMSQNGITSNKPVILYCTSSVRAGIVYAALTNVAGYSNVKVYEGALYEWIAKGNKVD